MAYDAKLVDTLNTPSGSVMSEQSWDLGDIQPNEIIKLTYTVSFAKDAPSGFYKNSAHLIAHKKDNDPTSILKVNDGVYTVEVRGGVGFAVGNLEILGFYPKPDGTSGAMVTWESTKPGGGQLFWNAKASTSPYNPLAYNYGYAKSSLYVGTSTLKHYAYMDGLISGKEYIYRVRSKGIAGSAFSSEVPFTVPGVYVPPITSYKPVAPKTATVVSKKVTPTATVSASATASPTAKAPKSTLGTFVSSVASLFKNPF